MEFVNGKDDIPFFEMDKNKLWNHQPVIYLWTSVNLLGLFHPKTTVNIPKINRIAKKKLIGLNKKNNCHICCTNKQQWSYKESLNKSTYKGVCDLIIHITAVNIHITAGFPYHKLGKKVGLISEGLITTFGGEFLFSWSSHI